MLKDFLPAAIFLAMIMVLYGTFAWLVIEAYDGDRLCAMIATALGRQVRCSRYFGPSAFVHCAVDTMGSLPDSGATILSC